MFYGLAAACILLAIAIILQAIKITKLNKKVNGVVEKYNSFVDFVHDEIDEIYVQVNRTIDDINNEFHDVYDVLGASKEFADDLTDTMELMCDTDEMIINRINDIEEELAYQNVVIDDMDALLFDMFENEPEEVNKKKK